MKSTADLVIRSSRGSRVVGYQVSGTNNGLASAGDILSEGPEGILLCFPFFSRRRTTWKKGQEGGEWHEYMCQARTRQRPREQKLCDSEQ